MRPGFRLLLLLVLVTSWSAAVFAADTGLHGRVVDPSGLPLPGVTVTLTPAGGQPLVAVTDPNGEYRLDAPSGTYSFRAELSGFEPQVQDRLQVGDSRVEQNFTLQLAGIQQQVTVVAEAPSVLGSSDAAQPATLSRTVIDNAARPTNTYLDVLPLIPNVVRGRDGLISVAGAREPQGALLVNGVRETDPVTGQFAATLPLAAVDSVQVFANTASSEFGRSTGGVTEVHTRSGDDKLRFSINSLDPRLHIVRGRITGVDAWEPNGGLSGPIVKGRAWFAQSIDFRYGRTFYDTVVGRQVAAQHAFISLSQVDVQVKPGHLLTGWFSAYPQTQHDANLNAFNPATTVPDMHRGGWTATLIDRSTLGETATLESRGQVKRLDLLLTPNNLSPYVVGHDVTRGGYFNDQDRTSYRTEWSEVYTRTSSGRYGDHLLKAGASLGYVTFTGTNSSRPVALVRSDGTLSRSVQFVGNPAVDASAYEAGLFIQDTWNVLPSLKLEVGTRFDQTTLGRSRPAFAPRAGWTYTIDDRTSLSGNAGLFTDKLVIGAGAFPTLQSRVVTDFDPTGTQVLSTRVYRNAIDGSLRLPYAASWNVRLDRQLPSDWLVRLNYQERHGYDELIVTPHDLSPTAGVLALSSTGSSFARSLETTVGHRGGKNRYEMYVSYVRAATRGNLNDLNVVEGNFKQPLVQPDQIGPLAVDVPNRLLVWGIVSLPWRTTVAPFLEVRNGFPFSPIDENWNDVGLRNGDRLPVFASLDLVVQKILKLPFGLPHARLGFRLYNVTGRYNGRDIQADILRTDFGTTYNPIRRQLRGIFELEWGK